jgi:PiT family inorganic phosphate transporter
MLLIFLSSGLFLGWSLGANDAANIFGTAVGTKMIRFKTAALICGLFVTLGAVVGGAGATHTLGKLGAVNALAGAFMVATAAGFTVFWMTKLKMPVSTSQAIVGAIIGWNIFTGSPTDQGTLTIIVMTWVLCPVLAAIFSIVLYTITRLILNRLKIHLLALDSYTRIGLIVVGAFGAYSLGANNIANVMGVFVPGAPFDDLVIGGQLLLSGTQLLFLLGGLAIAVGAYTYSRRVMETVGGNLLKLSPITALIIVLAQALVLFVFSSRELESWLISNGLPSFPLVPVSSSQAVIGAVLGIGLIKGARGIKFHVLGEVSMGWITTPLIAGVITFFSLFFLQNVFDQEVSKKVTYRVSNEVLSKLASEGVNIDNLNLLNGNHYSDYKAVVDELNNFGDLSDHQKELVISYTREEIFVIDSLKIETDLDHSWFTPLQLTAIESVRGRKFYYSWHLLDELGKKSDEWKLKTDMPIDFSYNNELRRKQTFILNLFRQKYTQKITR